MSSKAPTSRCRKTPLSDLASRKAQRNTRYIQVLTRAPTCSFFPVLFFVHCITYQPTRNFWRCHLSPCVHGKLFSVFCCSTTNRQTKKREKERSAKRKQILKRKVKNTTCKTKPETRNKQHRHTQHNTTNKSVIATRCNDCQTRLDNTQNVCKNATNNNKIMLIAWCHSYEWIHQDPFILLVICFGPFIFFLLRSIRFRPDTPSRLLGPICRLHQRQWRRTRV